MGLTQHKKIKDLWLEGPEAYRKGNRYDVYVNPPGAYDRTGEDRSPMQAGYVLIYPECVMAQFHPSDYYKYYIPSAKSMKNIVFDSNEKEQAFKWVRNEFYNWLAESILRIARQVK